MKIVIAMDSFKGSLSAAEACQAVRKGIRAASPQAEVVIKPMADGGEGTATALMAACDGVWRPHEVMGPLPEIRADAGYAWLPEERRGVVEMAAASGLPLLRSDQRNPLLTTTYGTGELIRAAADHDAAQITLAIGGSATVDGGVGAAMALGWSCLDEQGQPVELGGAGVRTIAFLEPPACPLPCSVEVLCDVDNPLCGPEGAAAVYGPQKGATPDMVAQLDDALLHLAELVKKDLGKEVCDVPGGGAAGGLGAGAMAFFDAKLVPGVDTVMRASGILDEMADAQWVVTGEGRFDSQSLRGKVVSGVVRAARTAGARVAVLAGQVDVASEVYRPLGVDVALSSGQTGVRVEVQMANALRDLTSAAEAFARNYLGVP